ncbi:MAG: ribonucleoside-diphosphate reductase, adenosylcobalamin-dependent, partial [Candidatus Aenigmarchaeota archaeon]|nr:ribonucleoside-diphosphate reductase, adenosylcobalamin-dependent [Candidatus Aenigmarchaeota archaeon]
NGFTTVIAPTGSISMIAGCSSGIEPAYTLVYEKHVAVGSFYYVDPVFEHRMKEEGIYDEALIADVNRNQGRIHGVQYVPPKMKKVFVTAMDITPEDHIKALAALQKWTDSSISKTNNFPASATVEDIKKSYLLAYRLGCKAVTVFRDSSIKGQVLRAAGTATAVGKLAIETANGNGNGNGTGMSGKPSKCPSCSGSLAMKEGCITCTQCGWGMC